MSKLIYKHIFSDKTNLGYELKFTEYEGKKGLKFRVYLDMTLIRTFRKRKIAEDWVTRFVKMLEE